MPHRQTWIAPRAFFIAAIVAALALAALDAAACSCVPPGPPRAELDQSDAVFVATVLGYTSGMRKVSADSYMEEPRNFRMRVLASWKAAEAESLVVRTGSGGGDCGYEFMTGDTYLIYAHRVRGSDTLATSICTRTRPLTSADEDFEELGVPIVDRREGRDWRAFEPPKACPLHHSVPLRMSWDWPQYTTTDVPLEDFERVAARDFPYAAAPLVRGSDDPKRRGGSVNDARVCPVCREAALAWLTANGAPCDVDVWIDREAGEREVAPGPAGELSDAEYRKRYPNANFAFLYDDGRRVTMDTIEGTYDRHIGMIRDTAFALTLTREELDHVYEKVIALRLFDVAEPHPTYVPSAPITKHGRCSRVRLFFRSDLLVRQLQWNARRTAEPEKLVPEWSKLAEVTALIEDIVAARPEVRALAPLPVD